jgi:hypothetical protein
VIRVWCRAVVRWLGRFADIPDVELTRSLINPQCGAQFRMGYPDRRPTSLRITIETRIERCLKCWYEKRYHKRDYFFA